MKYHEFTKEQEKVLNELNAIVEKMRNVMSEELVLANIELMKNYILIEVSKNLL